jgi:hypothetical protein
MTLKPRRPLRSLLLGACSATALLLASCGGGDDSPPEACAVADQQDWLRAYMRDWYFWYALSPNPSPAGYASVDDYYGALLYTGNSVDFPADRWSYSQSTESFNRFYGDGNSLGWGVAVAGAEVSGQPDQPLYVRYVEPRSPAAAAGVVRGDEVVSVNGRSAAQMIADEDYSALVAGSEGDALTLVLRQGAAERTLSLRAAVFGLTPVSNTAVVTSPEGRAMGYVMVKDMIEQALTPLDDAFAQFQAAGVQDLVLDLRYNGGGLVSVATSLGSYAAGDGADGQTLASLLYNDKHASSNQSFRFARLAASLGVNRVYVLTGSRTCSASELLINGLRPFVEVVTIGDTTCGKPVGFLPTGYCGVTYSAVNFESVNARNEGRYFDGFDATCPVAEDFAQTLGSPGEALLAEARQHADAGSCSAGPLAARERVKALRAAGQAPRKPRPEAGERQGMLGR